MLLVGDAVRRLGVKWLLFRVSYAVRLRTRALERRTPMLSWPDTAGVSRWPAVVDITMLRSALERRVTPNRLARLREHAEQVRTRNFQVFGSAARLDNWHHDPSIDARYDPAAHWASVAVPVGADVKRVWEPSRFTWAFDLARLHLLDPASKAADLFWELLDEWMAQNQPNAGINWGCGQEASFRLLSVLCAADAMSDTGTAERNALVRKLACVTAQRVEGNIDYARSQQNNHHTSEAMGLITCGLLFADTPEASGWLALGEEHLRDVCSTLVFDDGGTSQYSTNYHRVFLHDLVWTACVYAAADRPAPSWLEAAGRRATSFLDAVTEPESGSGPFFGPDDGARVLPLSDADHRQLIDDVELGAACFGVATANRAAEGCESLAWFGLDTPRNSERSDAARPFVASFPDIGVHVLASNKARVYVRATRWQFRPAHDDQLHCDVWIDGVNVVQDAGTATYHPGPGEPGPLSAADVHNGPRRRDLPGMVKASKFLWAKWTHGRAVSLEVIADEAVGEFVHTVGGVEMTRRVSVRESEVTITDTSAQPMVASWLVDDEQLGRLTLAGPVEEREGVASAQYGTSRPVTYRTVASRDVRGTHQMVARVE